MKKKLNIGMVADEDLPISLWNEAVMYEDDHGVMIEVNQDITIRINPQDFPKIIALMAETMDGMVQY